MLRLIALAALILTTACATLPEPTAAPLEEAALPKKAAGECRNDPCIRWIETPNGRYGEIDPECYKRQKAQKRTFPTLPQS